MWYVHTTGGPSAEEKDVLIDATVWMKIENTKDQSHQKDDLLCDPISTKCPRTGRSLQMGSGLVAARCWEEWEMRGFFGVVTRRG